MTYNGKTVIRMIGKMKGGSSADSICVKTDEHYRHRTTS